MSVSTITIRREKLHFMKKFNVQYSDLIDSDYSQLCEILVEVKNCYATHRNDVGKT